MSTLTPHETFQLSRPDTAAPFLYKSQGLPLHVPVATKKGTIYLRPDQVMNLDRVESDVIVNPQTSCPASFFNSTGSKFQFQILPSSYRVVHSYLEFDVTNTGGAALQTAPSPFLVDRVRIRNGAGNILQEMTGLQMYQEICASYSQNQLDNLQALLNLDSTTFASKGSLAAGASTTYLIPLSLSFMDQVKFFTGALGSSGLVIEVVSQGPTCFETAGTLQVNATRLRITAEYMSQRMRTRSSKNTGAKVMRTSSWIRLNRPIR